METDFKNAETCRPGSDLGLHFLADLKLDGFRGLNNDYAKNSKHFHNISLDFSHHQA
jgi:hypothetical protein